MPRVKNGQRGNESGDEAGDSQNVFGAPSISSASLYFARLSRNEDVKSEADNSIFGFGHHTDIGGSPPELPALKKRKVGLPSSSLPPSSLPPSSLPSASVVRRGRPPKGKECNQNQKPRVTPLKQDDVRHSRPRGRAPQGYIWDSNIGYWKSTSGAENYTGPYFTGPNPPIPAPVNGLNDDHNTYEPFRNNEFGFRAGEWLWWKKQVWRCPLEGEMCAINRSSEINCWKCGRFKQTTQGWHDDGLHDDDDDEGQEDIQRWVGVTNEV